MFTEPPKKSHPPFFTNAGTRLYPFVERTMSGKTWKFIALVVTTVGAIATAGPLRSSPAAQVRAPEPTQIAAPESVCTDRDVARTFGGEGSAGCQEYLDVCLGELTASERAAWRESVTACLSSDGPFYRCYAEVPWC